MKPNTSLANWRSDDMVASAMKERDCNDIQIVDCPACQWHTYYNEGSHWSCRNPKCPIVMNGDEAVECCYSIADAIEQEECDPFG